MSTATSDLRPFVIGSTRSSATNASDVSSNDLSKVGLTFLNVSVVLFTVLLFSRLKLDRLNPIFFMILFCLEHTNDFLERRRDGRAERTKR